MLSKIVNAQNLLFLVGSHSENVWAVTNGVIASASAATDDVNLTIMF